MNHTETHKYKDAAFGFVDVLYLLLRILHPAHGHLAPPLHVHWISVWRRRRVCLAGRVRAASRLLWVGVGVVGHAVKLRALHSHEVHGGHL